MSVKSIALFYGHVASNVGDIAINAGQVELLKRKYPGAKLTVVLLDSEESQYLRLAKQSFGQLENIDFVHFRSFSVDAESYVTDPSRILRECGVAEVDLIVLPSSEHFFAYHKPENYKSIFWRAIPALAAYSKGIPAILLPSTFGPFEEDLAKELIASLLQILTSYGVRDEASRKLIEQTFGHRIPLSCLDPAFFLTAPKIDKVDRNKIALPMRWEGWGIRLSKEEKESFQGYKAEAGLAASKAYQFAHSYAVRHLEANPANSVLIPVQTDADRKLAEELASTLAEVYGEDRVLLQRPESVPEYLAMLGRVRYVVTSRFHAAILSMISGTPAYGVYFESHGHKIPGLFSQLQIENRGLSLDKVSVADAVEKIYRSASKVERVSDSTAERIRTLKESTLDHYGAEGAQPLSAHDYISFSRHFGQLAKSLADAAHAANAKNRAARADRKVESLAKNAKERESRLKEDLAKQKNAAKDERANSKAEVRDLKLKFRKAKSEVERLQSVIDHGVEQRKGILEAFREATREELKRVEGQMRRKLQVKNEESASLLALMQERDRKIESLRDECERLKQSVSSAREGREVEKVKTFHLKENLDQEKAAREALEKERVDLSREITRLQQEVAKYVSAKEELVSILKTREDKVATLHSSSQKLMIDLDRARARIEDLEREIDDVKEQLKAERKNRTEAESERAYLQKEVFSLRERNERIVYELDRQKELAQSMEEGWRRKFDSLVLERGALQQANMVSTIYRGALSRKIEEMEIEMKGKEREMSIAEQEVLSLKRELEVMRRKLAERSIFSAAQQRRLNLLVESKRYRIGAEIANSAKSPINVFRLPYRLLSIARLNRAECVGAEAQSELLEQPFLGPPAWKRLTVGDVLHGISTTSQGQLGEDQRAIIQFAKSFGEEGYDEAKHQLILAAVSMKETELGLKALVWSCIRVGDVDRAFQVISRLEELAQSGDARVSQDWLRKVKSSARARDLSLNPEKTYELFDLADSAASESLECIDKRIAYILHNAFPYSSGGYATRAHGVLLGWKSAGFDPIAITRPGFPVDIKSDADVSGKFVKNEIDGIPYVHNLSPERKGRTAIEYMEEAADALTEQLRDIRPSAVVAASNHVTALPSLIAARRLGIPFYYEVRGFWEITRLSRDPDYERTSACEVQKGLEAGVAKRAEKVFTLTGPMRQELEARGVTKESIVLTPNACDPERFQPRERDKSLAGYYDIPEEVPVIGYIGTFVDYEGLEDLVEAAGRLKLDGVKFRLLLVGNENASGQDCGPITKEIMRIADSYDLSDWLIMPGRVPHEQVSAHYSLIDIAPFPRRPWPVCEMVSPMKPLEAMAMEKAVVVSSVRALAEMVEDNSTGLIYAKGDVEELQARLRHLIVNSAVRLKLGENARAWVLRNRTWSEIGKTMVDTISDVSQQVSPQ
ncbi:polysaccharide pyruvyl transferase family protein [Gammaproteobacteria bacterium AB-CW1]|uniref:Polysaccharide pyruvyl transferase family protein n=1 Tax=Natronospira elongata TaxID=3110268 RepID=A0AAP6JGB1_9GAMM|nr:polysaccharide pyruvyl transferase family protein [Gammaproteobacteria bacterium AB-CW1]